jgi:hypothetical protein
VGADGHKEGRPCLGGGRGMRSVWIRVHSSNWMVVLIAEFASGRCLISLKDRVYWGSIDPH